MIPVISVENIRKSDAFAIENFVSGEKLMQRAAQGVFDAVKWKGSIAIICGGGNNGGDGYALAAILKEHRQNVCLFQTSQKLTNDSKIYYEKCLGLGVEIKSFEEKTKLDNFDIIVDCIFGTGFKGVPRGLSLEAIKKINDSKAYKVSTDINSGLNGDNGLGEVVVKSSLTVSIGYYKSGHFLNMAKDVMEEKTNVDIGIKAIDKPFYLMEKEDFREIFFKRKNHSHKSDYGRVGILGGCKSYSGAIKLANLSQSALRAGCGLCKLIVPDCISHAIMPYLLESTLHTLSDQGEHMFFNEKELDKELENVNSLAIGMGWGESNENAKILTHILKNYNIRLVIDADGINTLAKIDKTLLMKTKCEVILTPHLGEFSRLTGLSIEEINQNPIALASDFAKKYEIVVLLKGATTIIADKNQVFLVDKGSPGMASGGSGDVLSGIIASINAFSKKSMLLNGACGAYIAGVAGELAAKELNEYSMLANDTIKHIPQAISKLIF